MSLGKNYIINQNDMKVLLDVIYWNCFICKTENVIKMVKRKKLGRIRTSNINTSIVQATAFFVRQ